MRCVGGRCSYNGRVPSSSNASPGDIYRESGWKEYQATGSVCGVTLPTGLRQSDRLPEPIFTPATKAESGHDINISEQQAGRLVGRDLIRRLRDITLALYARARGARRITRHHRGRYEVRIRPRW